MKSESIKFFLATPPSARRRKVAPPLMSPKQEPYESAEKPLASPIIKVTLPTPTRRPSVSQPPKVEVGGRTIRMPAARRRAESPIISSTTTGTSTRKRKICSNSSDQFNRPITTTRGNDASLPDYNVTTILAPVMSIIPSQLIMPAGSILGVPARTNSSRMPAPPKVWLIQQTALIPSRSQIPGQVINCVSVSPAVALLDISTASLIPVSATNVSSLPHS